ncbi:MAG: hypothetical protein WD379_05565 [Dehalococcoidia bacterium]
MEEHTPEQERYFGLTPTQLNLAFIGVVAAVALGVGAYFGGAGAAQDLLGGNDGSSSSATSAVETATPTPAATGDETPAPAPSPTGEAAGTPTPAPSDPVDAAAAQAAAEMAVLTLDDLPDGWTVAPPDSDDLDLDGVEEEFSDDCAELNEDEIPGEMASADSPDFESPGGKQVSSSASVLPSNAAAKEAVELFDSLITQCSEEWVGLFETGMLLALAEDGITASDADISLSLQELAFAPQGEATSAFRLSGSFTLEGVELLFTLDFVIIGQGRLVGALTYMSFFVTDLFEEQAIAEKLAERLAAASATLGD